MTGIELEPAGWIACGVLLALLGDGLAGWIRRRRDGAPAVSEIERVEVPAATLAEALDRLAELAVSVNPEASEASLARDRAGHAERLRKAIAHTSPRLPNPRFAAGGGGSPACGR